jgi:2'-5' RNA ligase
MSKPYQSALVVLVPQAEALVRAVHLRCGLELSQVPAHITVLFPFKPPAQVSEAVIVDLQRLFARLPPFSCSLASLGVFPKALYLAPTPGEPFVEMTRAVHERFPETPPYNGEFDEIVPHLTLAHLPDEGTVEQVVREVEEEVGPQLPIWIEVTEVCLLDNAGGEWCVHSSFPLGAGDVARPSGRAVPDCTAGEASGNVNGSRADWLD